jgi:hypothetical protein
MIWPCNHFPLIVCDIVPGAALVSFNHLLERVSRLEKDRSHKLNISESLGPMKDNSCGDARAEAQEEKSPVPEQNK